MWVPKRVCERFAAGMKRLLPIIQQQKARDVSEADTVTLVKDLLADVLGYDKYAELTSEHAVRGTYCDLAIRIEDKLVMLIEVKAIGITLDDKHVKQVVDYAANEGVEWVMLTNGVTWRFYHVIFEKPIDKQLIAEVDLTTVDCREEKDIQLLYSFTKEGFQKGLPAELSDRQDATSRYLIAALLLGHEAIHGAIRRELGRIVDVKVTEEQIVNVLRAEVLKRDAIEGPGAAAAALRVKRSQGKIAREPAVKGAMPENGVQVTIGPAVPSARSEPAI